MEKKRVYRKKAGRHTRGRYARIQVGSFLYRKVYEVLKLIDQGKRWEAIAELKKAYRRAVHHKLMMGSIDEQHWSVTFPVCVEVLNGKKDW